MRKRHAAILADKQLLYPTDMVRSVCWYRWLIHGGEHGREHVSGASGEMVP